MQTYVIDYFVTRHISLNENWVSEVVNYVQSKHRLVEERLAKSIFDQWLHLSLSETTNPCFQWPVGAGKTLNQILVFQIESVMDIGSSFWSQYRSTIQVADNFDFFDAVSVEDVPKEKEFENNASRMLMIELSDGQSKVKALEYRKLPFLSSKTLPGAKILLFGEIKHRKQMLLLTPANCQMLGGEAHDLVFRNRQEAVLGRKLKIAKYNNEIAPILTSSISNSTVSNVSQQQQQQQRGNTENRRSIVAAPPVATSRQPEVITLSPCRPKNAIIRKPANPSMPPETITLCDSQDRGPRISSSRIDIDVVPDSLAVVPPNQRQQQPLEQLSFDDVVAESPMSSPNPEDFNDNILHDSDIESPSPMATKSYNVTLSQQQRERQNVVNSIREDSDSDEIFSEAFLQHLSVSPIKSKSPVPVASSTRKRHSAPMTSTPREPLVKRQITSMIKPPPAAPKQRIQSSLPFKKIKPEPAFDDDDDILILEPSPSTSRVIKPEPGLVSASPIVAKNEETEPPQSTDIVDKFKELKLVSIAKALQRMRYSIGSVRMRIHAVMKNIVIPFHQEGNEWVMKILLTDETSTGLDCYVSNAVLVNLLGMTTTEAQAIKASHNPEKQQNGAAKLKSVKTQLSRLDIVFEIEFYSANTVPLIVGVETLSQLLLM